MLSIQEEFIKLICDKTKSAEDIFNIMQSNHKELLSTRKIFRGMKSWSKCIYQGTIGENDFIVAEASSTALTQDSVEMIYDDYRETMIRFIEIFR